MLDVNLLKEKYLNLGVTAFVAFWGSLGSIGGGMTAAGSGPWLTCATAFFGASLVMAASVWRAASRDGIKLWLPRGIEKIVSETDIAEPRSSALPVIDKSNVG